MLCDNRTILQLKNRSDKNESSNVYIHLYKLFLDRIKHINCRKIKSNK